MQTTDTRTRIALSDDIEVLETAPGKWIPYRLVKSPEGRIVRCPTRGFNKKGHMQWRTYATPDEARENLGL